MTETNQRDEALDLAAWMVEEFDPDDDTFMPEMLRRFGHLGREAVQRGIAIGSEILEARIAENQHEIAVLQASIPTAPELTGP